ncbi:MAG: SAM-dependent chlorinase/fluorinase [Desulforhopalus sp.]|nr:SAM-dependent chlorinase/fluorinase [Desulforhopalus sp.]
MSNINHPPIVTLLTDFGMQDEYAAVIKGVILRHAPTARLVDISHLIPPQSVTTASHLLARTYSYFPSHTIHLVIVDPGVGTSRAILAVAADSHYFVGPDNGVFTPVFEHANTLTVYRINPSQLFHKTCSSTFQGRDIMAPVAGQLAAGLDICRIGEKIDPRDCLFLEKSSCRREGKTLLGEIIHVDTFGNLCTNIKRQDVEEFSKGCDIAIYITTDLSVPLATTYSDFAKGTFLALFDSHDHLEIAANHGNAAQKLHIGTGAPITLSRR